MCKLLEKPFSEQQELYINKQALERNKQIKRVTLEEQKDVSKF